MEAGWGADVEVDVLCPSSVLCCGGRRSHLQSVLLSHVDHAAHRSLLLWGDKQAGAIPQCSLSSLQRRTGAFGYLHANRTPPPPFHPLSHIFTHTSHHAPLCAHSFCRALCSLYSRGVITEVCVYGGGGSLTLYT